MMKFEINESCHNQNLANQSHKTTQTTTTFKRRLNEYCQVTFGFS